jgi:hypothetical protein
MKKTDLDFKAAHDENGIPKCCMTCEKWSFRFGRSCDIKEPKSPCSSWLIAKYYKKEESP